MRPRGVDSFGACVDAGHRETQARHRFGDKAAAAADVEQGEPGEWLQRGGIASEVGCQLLVDKAQPGWIDAVQCPETSLGIPPALGLRCEAADFSGIDGAAGHAQLPILVARIVGRMELHHQKNYGSVRSPRQYGWASRQTCLALICPLWTP